MGKFNLQVNKNNGCCFLFFKGKKFLLRHTHRKNEVQIDLVTDEQLDAKESNLFLTVFQFRCVWRITRYKKTTY